MKHPLLSKDFWTWVWKGARYYAQCLFVGCDFRLPPNTVNPFLDDKPWTLVCRRCGKTLFVDD